MDEPQANQPAHPDDDPVSFGNVESGFSDADIDAQYARAVQAMDDADWEIEDVTGNVAVSETAAADESLSDNASESAVDPQVDDKAPATTPDEESASENHRVDTTGHRFSPEQILEAALFVGGKPLSSKKLAGLLGGSFDSSGVQALTEQLNRTYAEQARPYEVRLIEGGYRLSLREKYDRVRGRVFGVGPRDVRLSQDALDVLSFVAYRQPITREEIEETGKENVGSLLSQLVRRELIAIERDEQDAKRVHYRTLPRFLSLFGIGGLEELPQIDTFDHK